MRLRRLFAIVAATTTAIVISVGVAQLPAGALIDPQPPSVANIPGNPTVGTDFLASLSTDNDGTPSVTSSTQDVCTVAGDGLTVSFVAVGTCTLTAHVGAGSTYDASDGSPQFVSVSQGTPTSPTITNLPTNATTGGGFVAIVSTNGDGTPSVASNTPSVCSVAGDGVTVSFDDTGTCSLTAQVAPGTNYTGATGTAQTFQILLPPTTPTISNLPAAGDFGDGFSAVVGTDGDGTTFVTSSTPLVCSVADDGTTVSYVGVGSCTLTAHVAAGATYGAADGSPQSFNVSQAEPNTPTISNLPTSATFGDDFTAIVDTNGDGTTFVTTSTPTVCSVSGNVVTTFIGVGMCTLAAHVTAGTDFQAADGSDQSFSVAQAEPTTPSVSNLPGGATFGGGFVASVDTNGDGTKSVSSSSPGVCTVAGDGVTVSFIGVGTCTLTAHVAAGTDYQTADGTAQNFAVGQASPTSPSVSNIPASPPFGGQFAATVSTTGDGTPSVTSSTPGVCTVGGDKLTVSFVGVGTCSLTAHVSAGTDYLAADGVTQSFGVGQTAPSTPSVTNVPGSPAFGGGFVASVGTNGDGVKSVTSSTPAVCAIAGDGVTVSFVGVGTCTLTAHVATGTDYQAADGTGQSFGVGQTTASTPSVTNVPGSPVFGGGFQASVGTNGDGPKSVTSSSTAVCTIAGNGLSVSFVGVGSCTLTAHVASGTNYGAADGTAQSFAIGRAASSAPVITNLPGGGVAGGAFTASVTTNGDGPRSVASQTPAVCAVAGDGLTVSYVAAGNCTLTAKVGVGTHYGSGTGGPQTFGISPQPRGYWLVGTDGGIFSFGAAAFHGSMGGIPLQRPVVGITPTASKSGYWLVASDGGIFSFGDSAFYGSIPGLGLHPAGSGLPNSLNAPIVGMVPSSTGHGYFMIASDGGVFAFGDARFEGSCPGIGGCTGTAVAVMPDHSGNGYWLVTAAGAVYAFGDAPFFGSPPPSGSQAVSAVATPDGNGYWIVDANGAVSSFGDANAMGAPVGYVNVFNPATAIFPTSDGRGYWVAAARGDVFSYGDAPFLGSMAARGLNGQIIAGYGF